MSYGKNRRKAMRESYEQWVYFAAVDAASQEVSELVLTCSRDLSNLGAGILAAHPYDVGQEVAVQIRGTRDVDEALKYGVVRSSVPLGHWTLVGVEFVDAPEWFKTKSLDIMVNDAA